MNVTKEPPLAAWNFAENDREASARSGLFLNLGCGHVTPAGWINADGSNRAWLASRWPRVDRVLVALRILPMTEFSAGITYADLSSRFPWPDNFVDGIYMGEVLEHFTRHAGQHVLMECYRVLKPNGVIRIRVPDNARFWENYLNAYRATKAKPPAEWDTSHARWIEMFFRDICTSKPKAFRSMGHYHKWMYDEITLSRALEAVGFKDVQRMAFHDSKLPCIEKVEVRDELIEEATK